MCDMLVTKDGMEIWSLGDARLYGVPIPQSDIDSWGEDNCLCRCDLDNLIHQTPGQWKKSNFWGMGWSELDERGRTWWEGYDISEPDLETQVLHISRSDGREPRDIDEWRKAITETK